MKAQVERNQRIGQMYAAGVPAAQIAAQFSLSLIRIRQLGRPWGGQRAKVLAEVRAKVVSDRRQRLLQRLLPMYVAGVPTSQIAQRCEVHVTTVRRIASRSDAIAKWRAQRLKAQAEHDQRALQTYIGDDADQIGLPERNRRIAKAYAAGLTLRQLGDRFGITRQRIQQIVTREIRRRSNVSMTGN